MEADALLGGLSREIRVFNCVRKKDRGGKSRVYSMRGEDDSDRPPSSITNDVQPRGFCTAIEIERFFFILDLSVLNYYT